MSTRVGILISGRGSNMESLHRAMAQDDFPAELVGVVSNNPDAAGLHYAQTQGIATAGLDHKLFDTREAFDREIDATLKNMGVELICLAGFMRILSPWFIGQWPGKILNIHPSLLPSFAGLHTHERAIQTGCKLHGCTVHVVTEALDDGPLIGQAAIPVLDGDTPDTLAERLLSVEHKLYPLALRRYLGDSVSVQYDGTALLSLG